MSIELVAAYILSLLFALLLLALPALLWAWLRIRRLRSRAVVQMLAVIVGQNLPLAQALRAAAHREAGALRRVFQQMASRLELGDTLSMALRCSLPACPGSLLGALQGAERGGTVPSVLRTLAADVRAEAHRPPEMRPSAVYPFVLAAIVPFVLAFILVAVLPKFRVIFADFETELPYVTQTLFAFGVWVEALSPWLLLALVVVALGLLQALIGRYFLVRVPDRFQLLPTLWDTLTWHLPLVRRLSEAAALAHQLPVLQAGVRAGHDLHEAARQAACVGTNYCARRRLGRWADALAAGHDPLDSARAQGLPGPVLRALAAARSGASLQASLEYLAAYYRSLRVHWGRVLVSIFTPVMVLLWALCIGYIALALFLPLIALIDSMMADVF